jgi:hypothetical protein
MNQFFIFSYIKIHYQHILTSIAYLGVLTIVNFAQVLVISNFEPKFEIFLCSFLQTRSYISSFVICDSKKNQQCYEDLKVS